VGQPLQLVPQTTPDYGEAPPAPEEGGGTGQPNAPQGFEISPLEAVGADYAGTLEPDHGGLGIDMWRGTDRVRVERLLPLLKPSSSPILTGLTRRLVLSNAASPAGKGSGASLLPPRARLLADMGLVEDAVALLKLQPPDQRDAASARLLVELSWRAGDLDGACATVQESVPRLPVDSFWQQATIFCQLRAGQSSEAMLSLDLLREQGDSDEAFFALADALDGNREAKVPPLPVVTPLYLAMARAAGIPLPAVAIREPPPLMLALAESPDAPVEQRLAAAETAAAAGVLSPQHLAAAYAAEPEDPGTSTPPSTCRTSVPRRRHARPSIRPRSMPACRSSGRSSSRRRWRPMRSTATTGRASRSICPCSPTSRRRRNSPGSPPTLRAIFMLAASCARPGRGSH
jgi:hypothetical protein